MKRTGIDPANILFTLILGVLSIATVVSVQEATRSYSLEKYGVVKQAEIVDIGAPDADGTGYVVLWRVPGSDSPTMPQEYCHELSHRQIGEHADVWVHPDDPELHRATCRPLSLESGKRSPLLVVVLALIGLAIANGVRSMAAADRALWPRLFAAAATGLVAGSVANILLKLASPTAINLVLGGFAVPAAALTFVVSRHIRGIDRDLAIARGSVAGSADAAARRLKSRLGRNPVGTAALQLLLGNPVAAFHFLRGHHALAVSTGDLYGLVHGLYALAQGGLAGAHTVMQGLLAIGKLDDPSFDRFRAYVLARAAATAIHYDERARELALAVERELLSSSDSEVSDYAHFVRTAREAEQDDHDDPQALERASKLAHEVGLTELAALMERRQNRLRSAGSGYRAA